MGCDRAAAENLQGLEVRDEKRVEPLVLSATPGVHPGDMDVWASDREPAAVDWSASSA